MRIAKSASVLVFPAILTFSDVSRVGVFRIVISTQRVVVAISAARALVLLRQHFLKLDAVFFDVLVYSE
jgi:hypothetical protein